MLIVLATSAVLWVSAEADERTQLPSWVTAMVGNEFPKAKIVNGHREGDRDENRYEVKLRGDDGKPISVDLTEDAGIVDVDQEIGKDQLPERVVRGLKRAFPRCEIRHTEKHTDIRDSYSIDIVSDGKKREVTLSPRGRVVEIEDRD